MTDGSNGPEYPVFVVDVDDLPVAYDTRSGSLYELSRHAADVIDGDSTNGPACEAATAAAAHHGLLRQVPDGVVPTPAPEHVRQIATGVDVPLQVLGQTRWEHPDGMGGNEISWKG